MLSTMIAPSNRKLFLFVAIITTVSVMVFLAAHALAQGEIGIEVSPTSVSPTMAVGDETRELITIRNSSDTEMLVSTQSQLAEGVSDEDLKLEIQPAEIRIAPGDSAQAALLIEVAPESEARNSRAVAFFLVEPLNGRDVSISGQVAVTVDVKVIRPIEDVNLSTPHFSDANGSLLFIAGARNNGKFPTRLQSRVSLTGLFVDDVNLTASSDELAVGEGGSVEVEWPEPPAFAVRWVHHSVGTGVGSPVEEDGLLIIAPWRLALMLLVVAAAVTVGAFIPPAFTNVFPTKGRNSR